MQRDFIVIDFETACQRHDSPCSLGLIVVRQLEIVSEKCYMINPQINKWSPINIGIHHIHPEMVACSPEFYQIWPEIKPFFSNTLVVAHNISFDHSVLTKTLERYNLQKPIFQTSCTLEQSREFFPTLKKHKLDIICKLMNIELNNHHEALADAKACALLRIAFEKGQHKKVSLEEISQANTAIPTLKRNIHDGHERFTGSVLKPNFDIDLKNNPFYMKKVVITGVFSGFSRIGLAEFIKNHGADIDTSITKRTDFVIVGTNPGPEKLKKIEKFINEGYCIQTIDEPALNQMVGNKF